jgi:hypothetical protein
MFGLRVPLVDDFNYCGEVREDEGVSRYDVHTASVEGPEDATTGWTQVMVRHRKENRRWKSKTIL